MIDRTKFRYNIGDIVEIHARGNMYKATIIAYCFNPSFNDYTNFYCYGLLIDDDKFYGHSCNNTPYDYNGNKLSIKTNKGWYALEKNFKVVKSTRAFIYKLLFI